jgi:uncharacterized protein YbaA (DUF1428 family)
MSYIFGSVIPLPAGKKQEYIDSAARRAPILKEYGATRIIECWSTEIEPGTGVDPGTGVLGAARARPVAFVFSWIVWPSKEACYAGMRKVTADPNLAMGIPLYEGMQPILGGFEVLLDTDGELDK